VTGSSTLARVIRVRLTSWALLPVLLALIPVAAVAKPDFSRSTIALEPAVPKEGDVVTFLIHVRNSGDEPAPFTDVELELPLEAMFVDMTGLDGAKVDAPDKVIAATVDLPPGADRQFSVRMVIPHDAGGRSLAPRLKVSYLHADVVFYAGEPVTIDSHIAQTGVVLGGVRFTPASFVLIAVLLLYPVLRVLTASRKDTKGPIVLIVISVGFLSVFAGMAWHDWRTISAFQQSSCTILDSRLRVETSPSAISTQGRRRSQNTTYAALLALRYDAHGREVIGTGYSTGSRLSIGRGESTIREAAQFKIGAQVPCWFDPDDPTRVMVLPGFGGAYFFALLPLVLLVAGIWGLLGTRRA
jgi:hypothetical protein